MALVSPGVEVTIIDQSQYLPAAPASVPLVVLATAENKANAAGTGIAAATTAANANKLYMVTSQRDLVTLYGNPFFYKTTNGTPIQGYELNEYGLLAAYSVLGTTNKCFVLRADIDLASLVGRTGRPSGAPADATYWLDTANSTFGIYEFNQSTGLFTLQTPIVINDSDMLDISGNGAPLDSIGNIGDYAVTFVVDVNNYSNANQPNTYDTYWFKNNANTWVKLGGDEWRENWATVQGSTTSPTLTVGDKFIMTFNGVDTVISLSGTSVTSLASQISGANVPFTSAANVDGKLEIYCGTQDSITLSNYEKVISSIVRATNTVTVTTSSNHGLTTGNNVDISGVTGGTTSFNGSFSVTVTGLTTFTYSQSGADESGVVSGSSLVTAGTPLTELGIDEGTYYAPALVYATNAQQPLWRSTDAQPHPTGSVWIKTNAANRGTSLVVSQYSATTASFSSKSCVLSTSDWEITNTLDSGGGKNIAEGTLYAQYDFNGEELNAPLQLYRRSTSGPAIFVGENTSPVFATVDFEVWVSTPASSSLDGPYTVSLTSGDGSTEFVTAWQAANIPNTTAAVAASGAIVLTHTAGGVIILDDLNESSSAVTEAGFEIGTTPEDCTPGAKWGPYKTVTTTGVASTGGGGTGATFDVETTGYVPTFTVNTDGEGGYAVGDILTVGGIYLVKVVTLSSNTEVISTIVRDGSNTVTVTTSSPHGLSNGDTVTIAGVTGGATSFNGTFGPITVTGASTFTYSQTGPAESGTTSGSSLVSGSSLSGVGTVQWVNGFATPQYMVQLSNWIPLSYIPNEISPTTYPANGTNWYYSVTNQIDIMTNQGGVWKGYKNVNYASNGLPQATGVNATDPNGPILTATAPETQSDGTPLVYGDLWVDTGDLENYPVISRWQDVDGVDQWVLIDNTDQLTENGIVFADARWATSGTVDPVFDELPSIVDLLSSNYLDLDAPDAGNYPQGTLLFNTRRSGYNVKQFVVNYFNSTNFPGVSLPAETSAWVTVSGNMTNGAPYMGRKAQRSMVVQAMNAAISTNQQVREEDTFFNLISCPNYPEAQSALVTLNNDRNETAYIIGDTPMRLPDDGNAIVSWATNAAGATSTGEEGCVTRNTYMGLYYPSGITTDLTGTEVAVPPSHMILRTMIYNDTVAYPWFAPAGQRRGIVDNATNIGYINPQSGEFTVTKNRLALRDVEYTNFINPIAFFTNLGILNFGNKNSFDSQSSLDRTNVARLVAYIRWNLQIALRPFIFEPNDTLTRSEARSVVQTLMADIQTKRGIYDYIVVCDESNNTPARIDRNELWVDVAIEPVKAAEFIYVPVRILNTGEIAGLGQNG